MGWTPLPIKEAIEAWIVIIKQNSKNGTVTKKMHSELMQLYTQLRLAIYLRANLLNKINKQLIRNRKKRMAKDLTETELDDDDMHSNADSISDVQWEFGKPEPAETEATMATDIEGDTTQNEENPGTEPTRTNDRKTQKSNTKKRESKTKNRLRQNQV